LHYKKLKRNNVYALESVITYSAFSFELICSDLHKLKTKNIVCGVPSASLAWTFQSLCFYDDTGNKNDAFDYMIIKSHLK